MWALCTFEQRLQLQYLAPVIHQVYDMCMSIINIHCVLFAISLILQRHVEPDGIHLGTCREALRFPVDTIVRTLSLLP